MRDVELHKQKIIDNHMYYRCGCIFMMVSMSMHTWCKYQLFEPISSNSIIVPTIYNINSTVFLLYLLWDIYAMTLSKNKAILFRKDLTIHHFVSLFLTISCINKYSPFISKALITECISTMNYFWRERKYFFSLNFYSLLCIFLVRFPACVYFIYMSKYNIYFKGAYFFILYDLFLIKQISLNVIRKIYSSI